MVWKLVSTHWNYFAERVIKRPILGFEFALQGGREDVHVYCKKLRYMPHESKVILTQIKLLLANSMTWQCATGGWGSPIVLLPKPHQEYIHMTKDSIWQMCVSYRDLNCATNPFEYHIGRYDGAIEGVDNGTLFLYLIIIPAYVGRI